MPAHFEPGLPVYGFVFPLVDQLSSREELGLVC